MSLADEIFALFTRRGSEAYYGEQVSMMEHMLQTAHFASEDDADPRLILAALLHDVGHLVEDVPADIAEWKTDARHEEAGARWLAARFSPQIANPVRLHVPAKRYLCATDPYYFAKLSRASVMTLKLQGGPMSPAESAAFEAEPFYEDAVRVRRWDDQGKVAGLKTAGLSDYRELIERFKSPIPP
jgi:phosphonate degradation associated HDIG domain protein